MFEKSIQCISSNLDISEISNMNLCDLLRGFNESIKLGQNELVMLFGTTLILKYKSKLNLEIWNIIEGVALASFELANYNINTPSKVLKWQHYCLEELKKKFEHTSRFEKLIAMQLESQGKYQEAMNIYKNILCQDPEDLTIRKRIISIFKAKGQIQKVNSLIQDHLSEYITDSEAWKDAAFIALNEGKDLRRALYCLQEVLLHDPQNVPIINTIAELYIGINDPLLSRKYFSLALNIDENNIRALWGILSCNDHILGTKSLCDQLRNDTKNKQIFCNLSKLSIKKLKKIYANIKILDNDIISPCEIAMRILDRYQIIHLLD
ncbi:hypothetical protein cand_001930 [Cryptosporidium andersoni]|uniref:ER membrane protein complex subunit 2 n=1 Tax=Cryptosporidium andersoni TaxID=117008 RepID=A0A1J4MQA1_9CRYT|nr:hypothetical protein cand_001930 [Cryptosporidium andersoni]